MVSSMLKRQKPGMGLRSAAWRMPEPAVPSGAFGSSLRPTMASGSSFAPQPSAAPAPTAQPTSMFGGTNFGDKYNWGGGEVDWAETRQIPQYLIDMLGGATNSQIQSLYKFLPMQDIFRSKALQALDPGHVQSTIDEYRKTLEGQAGDHGRAISAMLRSKGILGADAAAELDAQNQAASGANQFASQQQGVAGQLQRALQGLDLTDPRNIATIIPMLLALDSNVQSFTSINNADNAARNQGGLGGILGTLAGSLTGGGINWGSILGRGMSAANSGTGSNAYDAYRYR